MRLLISELAARGGRRITYGAIAQATGIERHRLSAMDQPGGVARYGARELDALAIFFDCTPGELIQFDPIEIPIPIKYPGWRGPRRTDD